MKRAVYDTYVTKNAGGIMHFDIVVPGGLPYETLLEFRNGYLKGVCQEEQPLSAKECDLYHAGQASSAVKETIRAQGFHIIDMDGSC